MKTALLAVLTLLSYMACGQSPTDLNADINLPANAAYTNSSSGAPTFGTVPQIEASFNYARRQEEIQMGLPVGSLENLALPAAFSGSSQREQALYLINQERLARVGQNYPGSANVLGLLLEGLEGNLNTLASAHATDMLTNGFFGHIGSDSRNPYQRIGDSPAYSPSCRNANFAYSENIYRTCTYSSTPPAAGASPPVVPFLTAQAIYSWIYRDAGSLWGHRRALLIQNTDPYLSGTSGYVNDHSGATSEGFLGIGVGSVVDYAACSSLPGFYKTGGHVVVLNVADPSANANCTFDIIQDPLPVTLIQFSGKKLADFVQLEWITTVETDNKGFNIERSEDARTWRNIAFVDPTPVKDSRHAYRYSDYEPVLSITYYRLVQEDFDGTLSYSRVVAVLDRMVLKNTYIFPNPSSGKTFRVFSKNIKAKKIQILDMLG